MKKTKLVPYRPIGVLSEMFESEGFFERFWSDFTKGIGLLGDFRLRDTGKALQVSANIDGFTPKNIAIDIKDDLLRVRGKKEDHLEKREKGHYEYRSTSIAFEHVERLPVKVAGDKIETNYNNGRVNLTLPKVA